MLAIKTIFLNSLKFDTFWMNYHFWHVMHLNCIIIEKSASWENLIFSFYSSDKWNRFVVHSWFSFLGIMNFLGNLSQAESFSCLSLYYNVVKGLCDTSFFLNRLGKWGLKEKIQTSLLDHRLILVGLCF